MRMGRPRGTASAAAFTLLEVMIAVALFFMCVFAILGLVARTLNQARNLEPLQVDASFAAAMLSLTNRLEEGTMPPEIIQQYEAMNPGYTVEGTITEVATNGLFRVDFMVGGVNTGKKVITGGSSMLLWRPLSQPGSASRGGFR